MSRKHNIATIDRIHPNHLRDFAISLIGSLRRKSYRFNKANKNLVKQGETIERLKKEIRLLRGR